ncbi:uncharacterized protein LOC136075333 [Hydra vulgaris]|uniref:Uncharacterized protein LOC136075333 n=1 Tax=Hydra vulgaris TaxID=6087 RepID=A0ABM4B5T6_HYDVU
MEYKKKYGHANGGHKRKSIGINESMTQILPAKRFCHSITQTEHDVTDDLLALLSEECNKLRPDVLFLKSQVRLIIGTLKKHCQNNTVKHFEEFKSGYASSSGVYYIFLKGIQFV